MSADEPAVLAREPRRHWWVNHGGSSREEIEGSYLWHPRKGRSAAAAASADNMTRAAPADIVFSHAAGSVGAIAVVIDRVRTAPAPGKPEPAGAGPSGERSPLEVGWLLPVRFEALPRPLRLSEHMSALAGLLSARHAPLRATGAAAAGVYLAEIPAPMAEALRELLGGQLQRIEEEIAIETRERCTDAAIEEQIWRRTDLDLRAKRQLLNARLGQGVFRENLERIETSCRVTGVPDRRHLRAAHIKPWRLADDREKLDGFNGLLLSPHIEHLFDRGHISFADDGLLLISRHLNPFVTGAWRLNQPHPPQSFRPEQRGYLDFHRRHIFERQSGGRRG